MKLLASEHRVNHYVTVAYSPLVNSIVKNANRHIPAACNAIFTDLKLASHDWPRFVPPITSILNKAPSRLLGKRRKVSFRTLLEVMTGIQPRRNILFSDIPSSFKLQLDRILVKKLISIDVLQNTLAGMYKDTTVRWRENAKSRSMSTRNAPTSSNRISRPTPLCSSVAHRTGAPNSTLDGWDHDALSRSTAILYSTLRYLAVHQSKKYTALVFFCTGIAKKM